MLFFFFDRLILFYFIKVFEINITLRWIYSYLVSEGYLGKEIVNSSTVYGGK